MWKSCQGRNVPSKEGSETETADKFGEQQVLQFSRERGIVDGEADQRWGQREAKSSLLCKTKEFELDPEVIEDAFKGQETISHMFLSLIFQTSQLFSGVL